MKLDVKSLQNICIYSDLILSKYSAFPGLENLHFNFDGESELTIIVSNGVTYSKFRLSVERDKESACTFAVNGEVLVNLIQTFVTDKIILKIDDNKIIIIDGKAKFNIPITVNMEPLIVPELKDNWNKYNTDVGEFASVVSLVTDLSRDKDDRPVIFIDFESKKLAISSITGTRMYFISCATESNNNNEFTIAIPFEEFKILKGIFKHRSECKDKTDTVIIYAGKDQPVAIIHLGDLVITTRLYLTKKPNIETLISHPRPNMLKIEKSEFAKILRQIRIMTGASIPISDLFLSSNKTCALRFKGQLSDGELISQLKCDYQGEELLLAFNHLYMLEGISCMKDDLTITFPPSGEFIPWKIYDGNIIFMLAAARKRD